MTDDNPAAAVKAGRKLKLVSVLRTTMIVDEEGPVWLRLEFQPGEHMVIKLNDRWFVEHEDHDVQAN